MFLKILFDLFYTTSLTETKNIMKQKALYIYDIFGAFFFPFHYSIFFHFFFIHRILYGR
jgi:hypothetical protein